MTQHEGCDLITNRRVYDCRSNQLGTKRMVKIYVLLSYFWEIYKLNCYKHHQHIINYYLPVLTSICAISSFKSSGRSNYILSLHLTSLFIFGFVLTKYVDLYVKGTKITISKKGLINSRRIMTNHDCIRIENEYTLYKC